MLRIGFEEKKRTNTEDDPMRMLCLAAIPFVSLSGCASIVNGQTQVVSVKTLVQGAEIGKADCTMLNNKGTWYVTTPGTVSVHRSYQDLHVTCKKDGMDPGTATVKSSTKGMAYGNILFGGVIGAGVDAGTGAAYDYPQLISVTMGQAIAFPSPSPENNGNADKSAAVTDTAAAAETNAKN
jgi:hypothetical protein